MTNYLNEREQFFKGAENNPKLNEVKNHDMLQRMFDLQSALDERIINERSINLNLDGWVTGITIAMESEIDEIRREVNWKWWKNWKEVDMEALQKEVIDLWRFLLSLSRIVGLEPTDIYEIYEIYVKKNVENHDRQSGKTEKDGYEVKTEMDSV